MAVGRLLKTLVGLALVAGVALLLLAAALRPPRATVPPAGVVLRRVTVVEPGGLRLDDRVVTVRGNRIESVDPWKRPQAPSFAGRDRYEGRFVLPGLVDLHVHHPPAFAVGERELFALLFLAHGVTAVRDVGSLGGSLLGHRRRIADGELAGPRVFACGPFLDGDPPGWPGARVVRDAASALESVEALARSGVDCLKVYNGVSLPAFRAIAAEATARGMPLVTHVPDAVPLEAIEDAEVQHLMGLVDDWRQLGEARIDYYVRRSAQQRLRHTPTLVAFARGASLVDLAGVRRDPVARLLPRYYREVLWNPERNSLIFDLAPYGFAELAARLEGMRRVVRRLHEAGVPLGAGSDTLNPFVVPGASLQEELGHLVAAGLRPEEAWQAATRAAAEALGVEGLGTIRPGAPADLLVFRQDPSRDLAALATLEAVVASGRLYPKPELDDALERQLAHFAGPLYEGLSQRLARAAVARFAPVAP